MNPLDISQLHPLDVEIERWIARLADPQYRAFLAGLYRMCLPDIPAGPMKGKINRKRPDYPSARLFALSHPTK